MTGQTVSISITIKAGNRVTQINQEVPFSNLDEGINDIMQGTGRMVLKAGIAGIDDILRKEIPERWQNVGTEERSVLTCLGPIRYKRRIYRDENGRRRKPVDEILGIERYARDSRRVRQMGAWLACEGTYRQAAGQLSWMIKYHVSHSAIQRMVWQVGNHLADTEEAERIRIFGSGGECNKGTTRSAVLYGESDGVWLHLQREKKRSIEVRVATMYTGKKAIGKNRYGLENKCSMLAMGMNSDTWQEYVLMTANRHYDLDTTQLLVTGGDGNQWVRHSFDRLAIKQEFILDRFHLARAARRAIGHNTKAQEIIRRLRQDGLPGVNQELRQMIDQTEGKRKEKLNEFNRYVFNNQDGVLDLEHRDSAYKPASLGVIEGNVDKLVVHRMKGRGCCWRLKGARAMLALCQHKDRLKDLALDFTPIAEHEPSRRGKRLEQDHREWLVGRMPIFFGSDQQKPWVKEWRKYIHDDWSLYSRFYGNS